MKGDRKTRGLVPFDDLEIGDVIRLRKWGKPMAFVGIARHPQSGAYCLYARETLTLGGEFVHVLGTRYLRGFVRRVARAPAKEET